MLYRPFGCTGWQVSDVGYGMWGMGGWSGSKDAESLASLHRTVADGCTFFDTAWAYGQGHSEHLLGEVVWAHPGVPLVVASKIPPKNMQWPGKAESAVADTYPPDHIRRYTDWRSSCFTPAHLEASVTRAARLAPLIPPGSTMPELPLRLILANPDVSTVIPGMRKTAHVEANLAASARGPLPGELVSALRAHRWDRTPSQTP